MVHKHLMDRKMEKDAMERAKKMMSGEMDKKPMKPMKGEGPKKPRY